MCCCLDFAPSIKNGSVRRKNELPNFERVPLASQRFKVRQSQRYPVRVTPRGQYNKRCQVCQEPQEPFCILANLLWSSTLSHGRLEPIAFYDLCGPWSVPKGVPRVQLRTNAFCCFSATAWLTRLVQFGKRRTGQAANSIGESPPSQL